jgi:hypothetical protein
MKVAPQPAPIVPMTVAIKNDNKTPLVVSPAARRKAGFKSGQELEIKASNGVITIVPKLPNADDACTLEQRRLIDARLKAALGEVQQGRTAGPFNTAEEMVASLKRELRLSGKKKSTRLSR